MPADLAIFMLDCHYGLLRSPELLLPARYDAAWWIVPGQWAGLRRGATFGWLRAPAELLPAVLPACFAGLRRLGPHELPAGRGPTEWLRQCPVLFRHRGHGGLYVPELVWAEQVWAALALGDQVVLTQGEELLFLGPAGEISRVPARTMPKLFQELKDRVFLQEAPHGPWLRADATGFEELTPASRRADRAGYPALGPDELPRHHSAVGRLLHPLQLQPAGPAWPPVRDFGPRALPRPVWRQCHRHFRRHVDFCVLHPALLQHLLYTAWLLANDYVRYDPDGMPWVDCRQPYQYAANVLLAGATLAELIEFGKLPELRPLLRQSLPPDYSQAHPNAAGGASAP